MCSIERGEKSKKHSTGNLKLSNCNVKTEQIHSDSSCRFAFFFFFFLMKGSNEQSLMRKAMICFVFKF